MLNSRLLTVEDVNSVLKHFGQGFVDYYTLDTRVLTIPDTWFAYDFIDVYRVSGSISFTVRNGLWTGGFRVLDSNVSNPSVTVSDGTITVTGSGLEWVVLVLELSPEFNHGEVFELDYTVEYTPVIRPCYEPVYLTMGFLDGDNPLMGLSVSDLVTGDSLTTDSDGLVTVSSPVGGEGDYDYILEADNNNVTVDYYFPYMRIQTELPVVLVNPTVYRDKVNVLEFRFLFDSEYPITEAILFNNNHIRLKVGNTYYEVTEFSGDSFSFTVPFGLSSMVDMVLLIGGNEYIDNYNVEFTVPSSFVTVDNVSDLITELGSDNPAGKIIFTGTVLDTQVSVNGDVSIQFTSDVSSLLDSVFSVNGGAVLTLEDLSFTGKRLVTLDNGECILTNCSLQHCTDTIIKGTGDLTVSNSSFVDNYSCIDVNGDVTCTNVLFDLSDTDYLDTGTPAFIRCTDSLSVDYCQFNLDLQGLSSLGLSYVMLWLGRDGVTNNTVNTDLTSNNVFPVLHNTGVVDVTSTNYRFRSDGNKCIVWTLEDTNTVYSNKLLVEYIGGE